MVDRPSDPERSEPMMNSTAPGYTYDQTLAPSPVSMGELDELKASVAWTDRDRAALRRAGQILVPRAEEILDVWYGFVGSHSHLVGTFAAADGQPSGEYLAAVRKRFALWIRDICERDYDQRWLDYQQEISLRHHTERKNQTDHVDSSSSYVPLRHLIALVAPVTLTIRPFLTDGESDGAQVDAMYAAWLKAVTLSVALWARSYAPSTW